MRKTFHEQMDVVHKNLIKMGALIERAIERATKALIDNELEKAYESIQYEKDADEKEKEIESLCIKILLTQQPVAKDLRLLSSALKIITDMERIGDQAADIAEIALIIPKSEHKINPDIEKMSKVAIQMVNDSVDAFVKSNLILAQDIITRDDIVDQYFIDIRSELIQMIQKEPDSGERAMDLLLVVKYLERIADHASNIAEWIIYSETGTHKDEIGQ